MSIGIGNSPKRVVVILFPQWGRGLCGNCNLPGYESERWMTTLSVVATVRVSTNLKLA